MGRLLGAYTIRAGDADYQTRGRESYIPWGLSEVAIIIVAEKYRSRQFSGRGGTVTFLATGSDDPVLVENSVLNSGDVPDSFGDMMRGGVRSLRLIAPEIYEVDVGYGFGQIDQDDPGASTREVSYDFEFGTESVTIKRSLGTTAYAPAGKTARDFKGLIGVSGPAGNQKVEGVAIQAPVSSFSYTYRAPDTVVNDDYLVGIEELVGTTNANPFKGRPAGEVLFMGAQGRQVYGESFAFEISFRFQRRLNETGITHGDIEAIVKEGWQYLWTHSQTTEDAAGKGVTVTPRGAYVETVYRSADWAALGDWVSA